MPTHDRKGNGKAHPGFAARLSLFVAGLFFVVTGIAAVKPHAQNTVDERNPHTYGSSEYRAFEEAQWVQSRTLELYQELSARFNRELAGLYPFGPLSAPDVSTHTVCNFFRAYETQIEPLRQQLDSMSSYRTEARFLSRLDSARNFLSATSCARFNPAIRIVFQPMDTARISSSPPRIWKLTDDFGVARAPHGIPHLNWRFGVPIALEVTWAEDTGLRPRQPQSDDDFETPDSSTVRFAKDGDWALMRFIDAYGKGYYDYGNGYSGSREDPSVVNLSFQVPLVPQPELRPPSPPSHFAETRSATLTRNPYEQRTALEVQLRFELFEAGKPRKYLVWPQSFPTRAPPAEW